MVGAAVSSSSWGGSMVGAAGQFPPRYIKPTFSPFGSTMPPPSEAHVQNVLTEVQEIPIERSHALLDVLRAERKYKCDKTVHMVWIYGIGQEGRLALHEMCGLMAAYVPNNKKNKLGLEADPFKTAEAAPLYLLRDMVSFELIAIWFG